MPPTALPARITVPDGVVLGPCMQALSEAQRNFVWALVETGGNEQRATELSGFGGTPGARRVATHRLTHDPKVLQAIREVSESHIKGAAFLAVAALYEIVSDPTHKDRLKAADMLLNRSGMIVATKHEVEVVHRDATTEELLERAQRAALALGMNAQKLLEDVGVKVIDAEFTAVEAQVARVPENALSSEGLEDLL